MAMVYDEHCLVKVEKEWSLRVEAMKRKGATLEGHPGVPENPEPGGGVRQGLP